MIHSLNKNKIKYSENFIININDNTKIGLISFVFSLSIFFLSIFLSEYTLLFTSFIFIFISFFISFQKEIFTIDKKNKIVTIEKKYEFLSFKIKEKSIIKIPFSDIVGFFTDNKTSVEHDIESDVYNKTIFYITLKTNKENYIFKSNFKRFEDANIITNKINSFISKKIENKDSKKTFLKNNNNNNNNNININTLKALSIKKDKNDNFVFTQHNRFIRFISFLFFIPAFSSFLFLSFNFEMFPFVFSALLSLLTAILFTYSSYIKITEHHILTRKGWFFVYNKKQIFNKSDINSFIIFCDSRNITEDSELYQYHIFAKLNNGSYIKDLFDNEYNNKDIAEEYVSLLNKLL